MEPARHTIVQQAVRDEADGLARVDIERRACQARNRAASVRAGLSDARRPTVAEVWAAELGHILIHLRRSGADRYDRKKHGEAEERQRDRLLTRAEIASARAAGHAVGGKVEILGDDRTGTVQQLLVTREADGSLARWYVVHVGDLQVCRAYGCDELEEVAAERLALVVAAS